MFHLLAVLIYGEVTLSHGVELMTNEDGVGSLLVCLEEALDSDLASLEAVWLGVIVRQEMLSVMELRR